jgi:hypothetical protein
MRIGMTWEHRTFTYTQIRRVADFATLCSECTIGPKHKEKQRDVYKSLLCGLSSGSSANRVGGNGIVLRGASGQSIGNVASGIVDSQWALDRAAWAQFGRRNRWNWLHRGISTSRIRHTVSGRTTLAQ